MATASQGHSNLGSAAKQWQSSYATAVNVGSGAVGGVGTMLDSKEDDLLELLILANKNLKKDGIKITFRKHPAASAEPQVKKLIGYYPSGEMQIIFEKDKKRVSCIRGMVSFGQYELMGISGINTGDPQRFEDSRDVVRWIRAKLK